MLLLFLFLLLLTLSISFVPSSFPFVFSFQLFYRVLMQNAHWDTLMETQLVIAGRGSQNSCRSKAKSEEIESFLKSTKLGDKYLWPLLLLLSSFWDGKGKKILWLLSHSSMSWNVEVSLWSRQSWIHPSIIIIWNKSRDGLFSITFKIQELLYSRLNSTFNQTFLLGLEIFGETLCHYYRVTSSSNTKYQVINVFYYSRIRTGGHSSKGISLCIWDPCSTDWALLIEMKQLHAWALDWKHFFLFWKLFFSYFRKIVNNNFFFFVVEWSHFLLRHNSANKKFVDCMQSFKGLTQFGVDIL